MMNNTETEALVILQEECAEVVQVISKIHRFGMDGKYGDKTNKQRLVQELGDVFALVAYLIERGVIDEDSITSAAEKKQNKLKKFSKLYG